MTTLHGGKQVRLSIRASAEELHELQGALQGTDAEIEVIDAETVSLPNAMRDQYSFEPALVKYAQDAVVFINTIGAAAKLVETVTNWVERRRKRPEQKSSPEPIVILIRETKLVVGDGSNTLELRKELEGLLLRHDDR